MTERFHSFTVVLEHDMRDEDAEATMAAISQLRGVLKVEGNVASPESFVAQERAREEIGRRLLAVVYPKRN